MFGPNMRAALAGLIRRKIDARDARGTGSGNRESAGELDAREARDRGYEGSDGENSYDSESDIEPLSSDELRALAREGQSRIKRRSAAGGGFGPLDPS